MTTDTQHFYFTPGTLIRCRDFEIVVVGTIEEGIVVRDRWIGKGEEIQHSVVSDDKVKAILRRSDTEIDACFDRKSPADLPLTSSETAFADQPSEKRMKALQKEAFCLAAQTVLSGGPYYVSRIETHYDEICKLALDRQRLNALGTRVNGRFEGRTWGAKSISNYCKIYFGMRRPHPRALIEKTSTGNSETRLSASQDALLKQCCHAWLSTDQPSGASIAKFVEKRFRDARATREQEGDASPFPTPHRNTVYRRLRRFSELETVIGREGFRTAQKRFSPTQSGVRAIKPGELIELDFWKGDVFTFSEKSRIWGELTPDVRKILKDGKPSGRKHERQRLWICVAIDVATRMILGAGIAERPNERTVIEVLDMVMRDKSDISRLAGCRLPWSAHCGIGTVVFDTGNEFFNDSVQTAIKAVGAGFFYGRAAVPADKPFIERHFGQLRTRFADELPGKAGFSPSCLVAYDSEGMAAFNAEEFRQLLIRHLVDSYPLEENSGLLGKRPLDAWRDAQKYGALPPPPPRVRRNATGLRVERVLTKEGVRICGLPFSDPELFPKHLRNGKMKVEVRIDPNDISEVTIVIGGKQIHLPNQRPDLGHHSLRTLMEAIKEMTKTRPQDRDFYEYVLAKYADDISEKIEIGVKKNGLPSTEITPEALNWFENNFCLRLNVMRSPEEMRSANMCDLLAGRSGTGIFSADDIETEKAEGPRLYADPVILASEAPLASPDNAEHQQQEEVIQPVRRRRRAVPMSDLPLPSEPTTPTSETRSRFSGIPKGKGRFT